VGVAGAEARLHPPPEFGESHTAHPMWPR
jgi:hypothetical protein